MNELKSILTQMLGANRVSDDDFELIAYSGGANADILRRPAMVVRPETTEQISEIIRHANRTKTAVMPLGGQTNVIGCHVEGALALDMTEMNKMIEVDEDAMTATAQAGITWSEFDYQIGKKGYIAGPGCHGGKASTLGGGVVLDCNGPRSAKYGLMGDQVVSLEVVLPTGDIVKTGSAANPGLGRFYRYAWASDLTGLFIGSHGIFGVITEVTLHIYPKPETKVAYGYWFETLESLCRAMHQLQRSNQTAGAIESMYSPEHPLPSSDFVPKSIWEKWLLIPIVVAGTKEEVELYSRMIDDVCSKEGEKIDPKITEKVWLIESPVRQIVARRPNLEYIPFVAPLCSNVPILKMPEIYRATMKLWEREDLENYKIDKAFHFFACKRNAVASPNLFFDARDPASVQKAREVITKTIDTLVKKGLAPHYLGRLKGTRDVMWGLGAYYNILKKIKRTLDPNNILNPGQLLMPAF